MIVQACLNGARPKTFNPALPLTPEAIAAEAAACLAAGAAELHLHPRDREGRESLDAATMDATLRAVRDRCPGTPVGVSTGAWIEGDPNRTLRCIADWRSRPNYASVNLSEEAAPAVMAGLARAGIGVEAGVATPEDVERLLRLAPRALRVLVEIEEQDEAAALAAADAVLRLLEGRLACPILLHGVEAGVWPLVRDAAARGLSTRVGLEDGADLPDGSPAAGNAALVAAAVGLLAGKL